MNILAIDTSSERGSVCLRIGQEVAGEVRLATSIQHSERLFQSVDFLFQNVDVTIEDIDIFAAARGPGSFTGLRVGLAAMDGFAFSKGKRSAGVSTLAALAWQVGATEAAIAPVLDARRGEIYSTLYGWKDEELVELRAPAVLQPAEWVDSLPREPIVFCGSGVVVLREEIRDHPDWHTVEVTPYLAATVAEIAATSRGEPLEPLYVRRSEAEMNRSG